jgi:hypothetical protein
LKATNHVEASFDIFQWFSGKKITLMIIDATSMVESNLLMK